MNYLIISNTGLITPQDLLIFGKSVKRGDETKIGQFGSGLVYALCKLISIGATPRIFSGTSEITLGTYETQYRDTVTKMLTVDGNVTNYSIEAGPKWKPWMAIREIVSNAIDEQDHNTVTRFNPEIKGEEGKTFFFIPMVEELHKVMQNFQNYFAFERTPYAYNSSGAIYKKENISPLVIYRKGIRCSDESRMTRFDYSFENIEIDENRLASSSKIHYAMNKFHNSIEDPELLLEFIKAEIMIDPDSNSLKKCYTTLANNGIKFTTKAIVRIGGLCAEGLIISGAAYSYLEKNNCIEDTVSKTRSGTFFRELEGNEIPERKEVEEFVEKYLKVPLVWVNSSGSISSLQEDKYVISKDYENYSNLQLKGKIVYSLGLGDAEKFVLAL